MWTPRDQQVSDSGEAFLLLCSDRFVVGLCAAVEVLLVVRCSAVEEHLINPDQGFVAAVPLNYICLKELIMMNGRGGNFSFSTWKRSHGSIWFLVTETSSGT